MSLSSLAACAAPVLVDRDDMDIDPSHREPDGGGASDAGPKPPVDVGPVGLDASDPSDGAPRDGGDRGPDSPEASTIDAGPSEAGPEAGPPETGPEAGPPEAAPPEAGPIVLPDEDDSEYQEPTETVTTVRGFVSMAPDFRRANGSRIATKLGNIVGNADQAGSYPNLFVCAVDKDGEFDADPVFAGDDDVLGCTRTKYDGGGEFDLTIKASGRGAGRELYLVTWFCDNPDGVVEVMGASAFQPSAALCARLNVTGAPAARRKFLHSGVQELAYGHDNYFNWNVSCPSAPGDTTQRKEVDCTENDEEPALVGRTQSRHAWNKEFVHTFRTLARAVENYNDFNPAQSRMGKSGCGPDGNMECKPCATEACQRTVEVVITPAVPAQATPLCKVDAQHNELIGFDTTCIIHGADGRLGTLNPFQPGHALGHIFLRRWTQDDASDRPHACGTATWTTGNDESETTREGYANLVAVAPWFVDNHGSLEYEGMSLVGDPSMAPALSGSCGSGTTCACAEGELNGIGRVTRFFVDLWDSDGDEPMDLASGDLLRIWSTFDQPEEYAECGPDGMNLQDFKQHFSALIPHYSWKNVTSYDAIAARNCVNRHRVADSGACDSTSMSCN